MRIRVGFVAVVAGALLLAGCSGSKPEVDSAEPVVMPCTDDPAATSTSTSVTFVSRAELPSAVSSEDVDRTLQLLLDSAEFGPCLRTGRATVTEMVPWGSATGKGGVGVVATVTFTEPVDLPVTVRGWNPSGGETDPLPEDDLGRMITAAVPRSARSHVSVESVYVSFVGDPGVYAAARLV
jgi:hypothetical protein